MPLRALGLLAALPALLPGSLPMPPGRDARAAGPAVTRAWITQGVQDGTMPLVAGRDGWFRAFLRTGDPNRPRPALRVDFLYPGGLRRTRTIVAEEAVPDPGTGTLAYGAALPGACIQPGMSFRVVAEPSGITSGQAIAAFPEGGGALPQEVLRVPPLPLTLVPLVCRDGSGAPVTGDVRQGAGRWLRPLRDLFPLASVDLRIRAARPLDTGLPMVSAAFDELQAIRNALEVARRASAPFGNWHGVFHFPEFGAMEGMGDFGEPCSPGNRSSLGFDADQGCGAFALTLAHEVAHTKGRRHAPCGGAAGLDPAFPDPAGRTGPGGFDVRAGAPVDGARTYDFMGYCRPVWTSAYTYRGLLDFFLADAARPRGAGRRCLVVPGRIQGGRASLEPALAFRTVPDPPTRGSMTLLLLDARGRTLREVPFEPTPEATNGAGSFVVAVPLPPRLEASLAVLEVRIPGGPGGRLGRSAPGSGPPPSASRWKGGWVRLAWDARAFPRALVRDPGSGDVLACCGGGEAFVRPQGRNLECLLSDGVRTTVRRIPLPARTLGPRRGNGSLDHGPPPATQRRRPALPARSPLQGLRAAARGQG